MLIFGIFCVKIALLVILWINLTCKGGLHGFVGYFGVFWQIIYICKLLPALIFARAIYALFLMHFLRFLHISGVILTNEQKRMFVFAILEGVMVGI